MLQHQWQCSGECIHRHIRTTIPRQGMSGATCSLSIQNRFSSSPGPCTSCALVEKTERIWNNTAVCQGGCTNQRMWTMSLVVKWTDTRETTLSRSPKQIQKLYRSYSNLEQSPGTTSHTDAYPNGEPAQAEWGKCFTIVDVKEGFLNIPLDHVSSLGDIGG